MDLNAIQAALGEAEFDGWLFYDHHRRDPIAYHILGIAPVMVTRRWYYFIPATGEPSKLVHRIERDNLAGVPGAQHEYSSWQEQREKLARILYGHRRVAMQYSGLNAIPYVGLVDAGTVELVKACGVEVVSSGDLVQQFEARWSPEALASHLAAGEVVHQSVRDAFGIMRDAVKAGRTISEYDVQQEITRWFAASGVVADEPPNVSVNAHSGNPHYSPIREHALPIRERDLVLLDLWAKQSKPGAVYFDITWMGYVGEEVPRRYAEIFDVVREARDAAIDLVQRAMREGRALRGCDVDDMARGAITRHGYAGYFVHRTGHSIGEEVHGNGANMDNFETHDGRRILPGTCFSIEPGIYLHDFGMRTEVNVYVDERDARVTGEVQQAVVPIMAQSW